MDASTIQRMLINVSAVILAFDVGSREFGLVFSNRNSFRRSGHFSFSFVSRDIFPEARGGASRFISAK
jgi:hypothetical protein